MNKAFERYDSVIKPPPENLFEDKTLAASPELIEIIQKNHTVREALIEIKEKCGDADTRHLIRTAKLMLVVLDSEDMHILPSDKKLLLEASMVHDVGKAKIPQEILHKPEKLSREEIEIMHKHVMRGVSFLRERGEFDLAEIVVRHHEMKGYPRSGEDRRKDDIEVAVDNRNKENSERRVPKFEYDRLARLLSIADIFESMGSRPYNEKKLPMEIFLARKKELKKFDSPEERRMIAILEENDSGMIFKKATEKATEKDAGLSLTSDAY